MSAPYPGPPPGTDPEPSAAPTAPVRRRWTRFLAWTALAAVAAFLAFALVWRVQGGRWERVESPSMGTAAPVGTLLWVKPEPFDHLRVGDFITFHPPGRSDITYSHRVYRLYPDHTISTKGEIPAPDPWRLKSSDIVGVVQMRWWGWGRVVQAAPVLIIGVLLVGAVLSWLGASRRGVWRLPAGLLLASIVLTVAIVWYRPFTDAEQLSFAPVRGGGANATYVSTGLLPMRLHAAHGAHVVLKSGEVGTVHVSQADADRRLRVDLHPAMPFWFWVLVVGVAFVNLLVGVFNLLPGLPLDGGRILRSIVWAISRNPITATRISARAGQVLDLTY